MILLILVDGVFGFIFSFSLLYCIKEVKESNNDLIKKSNILNIYFTIGVLISVFLWKIGIF